jgi:hypothetical protein
MACYFPFSDFGNGNFELPELGEVTAKNLREAYLAYGRV